MPKTTRTIDGFRPSPVAAPSVVDLVVTSVRDAILDGRIPAGERVSITQLAEDFGVSAIPVREALLRLEGEGLLELRRARQAIVSPIALEEMQDIYRIRITLEGDLVQRAGSAYRDEDLAALEDFVQQIERNSGDTAALRNAHNGFHRQLLLPVASPWDLRVLELLWSASDRYLQLIFRGYQRRGDVSGFVALHHDLAAVARRRDGVAMRTALTQHLEDGMLQIGEALERRAAEAHEASAQRG